MTKKILIVDDSALMRRVLCDIIDFDERFEVADSAADGLEALDFLSQKKYDAVVLDVNMPKMTGIELLEELQRRHISARVMMASSDTMEGAEVTLRALELGALDFIHKPDSAADMRLEDFKCRMLRTLDAVANGKKQAFRASPGKRHPVKKEDSRLFEIVKRQSAGLKANKIVAIASSTGGPKALQAVIPRLPADLNAPVLLVQHMPKGFTGYLADRLNGLSELTVKEAVEGEELVKGTVYVAMGGKHMNVQTVSGRHVIHYSDEPNREGVKPCANYMYESLMSCQYDEAVCVVMTGMGADGTEGIRALKEKKPVRVIIQDQRTSVVYGMPKSVEAAGLADNILPLEHIAREIVMNVGLT